MIRGLREVGWYVVYLVLFRGGGLLYTLIDAVSALRHDPFEHYTREHVDRGEH